MCFEVLMKNNKQEAQKKFPCMWLKIQVNFPMKTRKRLFYTYMNNNNNNKNQIRTSFSFEWYINVFLINSDKDNIVSN